MKLLGAVELWSCARQAWQAAEAAGNIEIVSCMQDPVGNCLKTFCAKYTRSTNCCFTTVGLGTVLWLRPSAIGLLVAHITQCATPLNLFLLSDNLL